MEKQPMRFLFVDQIDSRHDLEGAHVVSERAIVDHAEDLEGAIQFIKTYQYDAIYLRPTSFGALFGHSTAATPLAKLREKAPGVPILARCNNGSQFSRLSALLAGATAIVPEVMDPREIVLQLRNLALVRAGAPTAPIRIGNVYVDTLEHRVTVGKDEIHLTKKEYQLLEVLVLRRGALCTKTFIMDHLYGGLEDPNPKIVDVFVCKIRSKLAAAGGDYILQTKWGDGYIVERERVPSPTDPDVKCIGGFSQPPATHGEQLATAAA
jgi:two-component system cell cycle response regulator CtrA